MERIKGFDGLRFFSIMFVFCSHLGVASLLPNIPYLRQNVFYFISGGAGVNMFFAISGFLITSLLLHEKNEKGKINIKKFFIRRFLRLLPPIIPFYICIAIFMFFGLIEPAYLGLFVSMAYLYNFIPKDNRVFSAELSHTWSLGVEEQFYFTWPFILSYLKKSSIYILVVVVIIVSFAALQILPELYIHERQLKNLFFVDRWIIPAITPILIGSIIALYNHTNIDVVKNGVWLLVSLGVLFVPFYIPDGLFDSVRIFHSIGASLLLLWIFHNQSSGFVKVLDTKVISYVGKISYGLYIWQGFFIGNSPKEDPSIWIFVFPLNIILTFVVAILSYEFYEKRILKWKQKFK